MTETPPNTEALAALIIGIGNLPDRQGRWLHLRDEDHRHNGDMTAFERPDVLKAFTLGNYTNFVAEAAIEHNASEVGQEKIASYGEYGITFRYADARRAATLKAIETKFESANPGITQISDEHYSLFLRMIHNTAMLNNNREAQRQFVIDAYKLGDTANIAAIDEVLNVFAKVHPTIRELTDSPELNNQSIANVNGFFTDGTFKQDKNTAINYGAGHMDGEARSMPDLDGVDNKGGAFPGLSISYIGQDKEDRSNRTIPTEAQMLAHIQINPNKGYRAEVPDPPDFIVLQSSGQIIENRHPDRRVPSLAQLLESGRAIRLQAEAPVVAQTLANPTQTAQTDKPAPKPTATTASPTATPEAEAKDEGFKLENMPWWHIAGAALGAWFASGFGNGIWNIIAMAIGGFLGTALFGSIGTNIAENEENKAANAQNAQTDSTVRSLNELAISKTAASSLAFARVDSVSLPVADADRGALLDSPVLERTLSVNSLAIH